MATANSLLTDACADGIACLTDRDLLIAIAQAITDSLSMTATELLEAACVSGIACLDSRNLMVVIAEGTNQNSGGGGGSESGGGGEAGAGSPEGVVTADPGTTYYNTTDGSFWVKATGSGNTGWIELITS